MTNLWQLYLLCKLSKWVPDPSETSISTISTNNSASNKALLNLSNYDFNTLKASGCLAKRTCHHSRHSDISVWRPSLPQVLRRVQHGHFLNERPLFVYCRPQALFLNILTSCIQPQWEEPKRVSDYDYPQCERIHLNWRLKQCTRQHLWCLPRSNRSPLLVQELVKNSSSLVCIILGKFISCRRGSESFLTFRTLQDVFTSSLLRILLLRHVMCEG